MPGGSVLILSLRTLPRNEGEENADTAQLGRAGLAVWSLIDWPPLSGFIPLPEPGEDLFGPLGGVHAQAGATEVNSLTIVFAERALEGVAVRAL